MGPEISKMSGSFKILTLNNFYDSEIWTGEGEESSVCEHLCYL